jgi:ABC-type polysaccharide/polyol phosphate export system, permease component
MAGETMKVASVWNRRNKILLRELVVTDFKLRYQGSILGYLWSILKPIFLFIILYIVFDKFLRLGRDIEHFPVYLLVGIVLWNFFTEATVQGLQSIVSRGDLIRKINFPKFIIVVSGTISAFINLIINTIVILVFCVINGVSISAEALLIIPLIAELYVFSLAVAFFLATLNVKYRDIGYLWEIFLQAAFYATPVIYPLQMVVKQMPWAASWLMLNPVAQVVQDVRKVLVTQQTLQLYDLVSFPVMLTPFVAVIIVILLAVFYFRSNQRYFAESV